MRSASGRRLGSEAKRLREDGTDVVLIQPQADDLELMGGNLMSRRRRHEVIELAIRTVRRQLRAAGTPELLQSLPEGEPARVRRPAGAPATWPGLRAAVGPQRSAA
jgi:NTE family protein